MNYIYDVRGDGFRHAGCSFLRCSYFLLWIEAVAEEPNAAEQVALIMFGLMVHFKADALKGGMVAVALILLSSTRFDGSG